MINSLQLCVEHFLDISTKPTPLCLPSFLLPNELNSISPALLLLNANNGARKTEFGLLAGREDGAYFDIFLVEKSKNICITGRIFSMALIGGEQTNTTWLFSMRMFLGSKMMTSETFCVEVEGELR